MSQVVSMVEAKSRLAELVGQVKFGGKQYILERRGRPMAMLISIEEYELLRAQGAVVATESRPSLLSPELQRRQALLVAKARRLEQELGDPITGLGDLFSTLPAADDDFWIQIQEMS